ncbi:MAG: 4-hydroxyphenylpyruvate dioxygenase [Bryobacteraceae bacterium]|nr:4-hydroxyphenylpyruvate dioxygenase [Bryobacteraceae bacterium]
MVQQPVETALAAETDFLPLEGVDHLEFHVGNAKQAAYFYQSAFGMKRTAYRGLETGTRDRASYLLEQNRIRFVITAPLGGDSDIAERVRRHGDGVRDIALTVADAAAALRETVRRGAKVARDLETIEDEHGRVRLASIAAYGDVVHTFVERKDYRGPFLPGFTATPDEDPASRPTGLAYVDHVVGNVSLGEMDNWVRFYQDVMGFHVYQHFDDKDISTEYSALMSKVMAGGHDRIKFPINEPAEGQRKSQIEEYLEYNRGPGVQHIALGTGDIIETVSRLRGQGVEFLAAPDSYYEALPERVGSIREPLDRIRELGILVDRDDEGYLLQIFTKPVGDRPTLFFEIIQRRGSRSFGKGNFKALFEAIEREQRRRGNL